MPTHRDKPEGWDYWAYFRSAAYDDERRAERQRRLGIDPGAAAALRAQYEREGRAQREAERTRNSVPPPGMPS